MQKLFPQRKPRKTEGEDFPFIRRQVNSENLCCRIEMTRSNRDFPHQKAHKLFGKDFELFRSLMYMLSDLEIEAFDS